MILGNWEHWRNRVQEYIYPSDSKPEYSSILVPNVDNVRTSFLMETIAKQHKVGMLYDAHMHKRETEYDQRFQTRDKSN